MNNVNPWGDKSQDWRAPSRAKYLTSRVPIGDESAALGNISTEFPSLSPCVLHGQPWPESCSDPLVTHTRTAG